MPTAWCDSKVNKTGNHDELDMGSSSSHYLGKTKIKDTHITKEGMKNVKGKKDSK